MKKECTMYISFRGTQRRREEERQRVVGYIQVSGRIKPRITSKRKGGQRGGEHSETLLHKGGGGSYSAVE